MDREQEMLDLTRKLAELYFEKRDMESVAHCLEERTSWIGTGEDELCRNLAQAQEALMGELSEYGGSFTVTDTQFTFVPVSETVGIVYGTIRARPEDAQLSDENVRLSAVLERTEGGLKLLHLHFSHADPAQERGKFFVKQGIRGDNESLRHELSLRERQLINLTKNVPGGAHQCANDANLTLLSMSDGFLSMFGYTKEEIETLFDGKFVNMIFPGDRADVIRATYEQLENGVGFEMEYRVLCKFGQPIWVLDKGRLIDDGKGSRCFYCLLIDITQRKRQQEELRLSLERHQVIMNQATDIIFEWDILKDTLSFSPNWEKKFGYDAIDTNISGSISQSDNIHKDDIASFVKIMKDTAAGVPYSETEFRIRDKNGRFYWCRIRATTQYNSDGRPVKAVGVIVDIDEEKKQKQALLVQAQHDTLTGLYNKSTINALVQQRMQCAGTKGCQALLIIDVDHFKTVNDTYGHLSGDSVLSKVAAVLKGCIRSEDFAGRIGGDEFMVYLPEVPNETVVREKAERIVAAVGCIRPEADAPTVTCSIGAVVLPHGVNDFQTFYKYADRALYKRKNNGRSGVSLWDVAVEGDKIEGEQTISAVSDTIISDERAAAGKGLFVQQ